MINFYISIKVSNATFILASCISLLRHVLGVRGHHQAHINYAKNFSVYDTFSLLKALRMMQCCACVHRY